MKKPFTKSALSEAEQALKNWGIKYEIKPDGSLHVPKDLNISNKGLTELPDLSQVSVGGNFYCDSNQLTSLEGAPQSVGGYFSCASNQLTSLKGTPQSVGGNFSCGSNQLTSLEGGPQTVGGYFYCDSNQLTSLKGAPRFVTDSFYCDNNQLTSLEGAPTMFKKLMSDFGKFNSWDAIPEELRVSPQTKEEERQAAIEKSIEAATVLQAPLKLRGPLRFRL